MEDPQRWQAQATQHEGSWWTAWHEWLSQKGSESVVAARMPTPAQVLGDAPGKHVLVRYLDPANWRATQLGRLLLRNRPRGVRAHNRTVMQQGDRHVDLPE